MIARGSTVFALAVALAACASPTPYQPARLHGAEASEGYHEIQLEPGHWRVVFSGNDLISREKVETYLLYRSAELTVQHGYDWFRNIQSRTDTHTEAYVYHRPEPVLEGSLWGPHWRYHRHDWYGWRSWDPWGPRPFFDVSTVNSYEASAEIVMDHGAKPASDNSAFDAHAVLQTLAPTIVRPS